MTNENENPSSQAASADTIATQIGGLTSALTADGWSNASNAGSADDSNASEYDGDDDRPMITGGLLMQEAMAMVSITDREAPEVKVEFERVAEVHDEDDESDAGDAPPVKKSQGLSNATDLQTDVDIQHKPSENKQQNEERIDSKPKSTKITSSRSAVIKPQPTPPTASNVDGDVDPLDSNSEDPPPDKKEPQWIPGSEEERAEIIRQVEFYFCDENLAQDSHLLSRTGPTGDGWVSVNEILGFRRMRQFKPKPRVRAILKQSTMLEVRDEKFIRRKEPLRLAPQIDIKIAPKRDRDQKVAEKPWLTKGMFEPTGLEPNANDGPINPEDHVREARSYDPDESITIRMERAVARYLKKRKMHQKPLQIFSKFLLFGGMVGGQNMFTGGLTKKEEEEMDRDMVIDMKAQYGVPEHVITGLEPESGESSWIIDFEGMAKAFLSNEFFIHFDWYDQATVLETTNILRNFYSYLLVHDACPEFACDVQKAIDVCHVADKELPKLVNVDAGLPGDFNIACSTMLGGTYSSLGPVSSGGDWVLEEDKNLNADRKLTYQTFVTGIYAYCTDSQIDTFEKHLGGSEMLQQRTSKQIGLKILDIEYASGEAKEVYDNLADTAIKPAGKLHCVHWFVPHARPKDLPDDVEKQLKAQKGKRYEFIVEEETLKHCEKGMRFEATVNEMSDGFAWIDALECVYPSFYTWTLNDRARQWKEPGPPAAWMMGQNAKKQLEETFGKEVTLVEDDGPD